MWRRVNEFIDLEIYFDILIFYYNWLRIRKTECSHYCYQGISLTILRTTLFSALRIFLIFVYYLYTIYPFPFPYTTRLCPLLCFPCLQNRFKIKYWRHCSFPKSLWKLVALNSRTIIYKSRPMNPRTIYNIRF